MNLNEYNEETPENESNVEFDEMLDSLIHSIEENDAFLVNNSDLKKEELRDFCVFCKYLLWKYF